MSILLTPPPGSLSPRAPRTFSRRYFRSIAAVVFLLPGMAHAQARYDFPPDTLGVADQSLYFETNLGLIERATADAVDQALEGLRLPPGSDILISPLVVNDGNWFVEDYLARRLSHQGYNVHMRDHKKDEAPPAPSSSTNTPASDPGSAGVGGLADAMKRTSGSSSPDTAAADSASANPATTAAEPQNRPGPNQKAAGPRGKNAAQDEPLVLIPVPEGEGIVLTFRLVEFGVTYHDSWRRGFMGPRVVERLASVNLYCRLVSGGPENVLWVGRGKSERLDIVPKSKLDLLEGLTYPFTPKPVLRQEPLSRLLEPVLVTSIIGGLVYLFYTNQE